MRRIYLLCWYSFKSLKYWGLKKALTCKESGLGHRLFSGKRELEECLFVLFSLFISGTCSWFTILHVHLLFDLLNFGYLSTNSNFSATGVCVYPQVFISRISFTPDRGGRYGWCSWEVQWVLLHCEMSLMEYFQIRSSSSFTILRYRQRQCKHLCQSLYCCDT